MKKPSLTKSLIAFLLFLSPYYLFSQIFVGAASVPLDNNAQAGPTPPTITPPAGMTTGDLVVIFGEYRATATTISINSNGGQTWNTLAQNSGSTQTTYIFWCTFNGTWSTNPSIKVAAGSTSGLTSVMYVFHASHPNNTWSINVAQAIAGTAAGTTHTITGVTTNAPHTVTMAFWASAFANQWGSLSGSGWTAAGPNSQYRNTTGGQSSTAAFYLQTTGMGATGNVSQNETSGTLTASRTSIVAWSESPINDNCSDATVINTATTCINGTSSLTNQTLNGATVEGSGIATSCGGSTTSQDVWYKFVAQSLYPVVTLSGLGSSWGTSLRIQLLSGSCGSFSEMGCANNAPLYPSGPLTIGQTYYVRVLKNNTTAPTGGSAVWAFTICITDPSPTTYTSISRMNEVFQQTILSPNNVLQYPWEVTYGPDGYLWVTEAHGYKAYRIDPSTGARTTILDVSNGSNTSELTTTEHTNFNVSFTSSQNPWPQGGFAGLAIHPQFNSGKPYIYISYVKRYDSTSVTANAGVFFTNYLVRFTYNTSTGKLESPVALCDTLPGSSDHNSQRIIIVPVSGTYYLFYAQGDMGAGQFGNAQRTNKAQNPNSYQGKILRFNLDSTGSGTGLDKWIPDDNPLNGAKKSAVWSIGIRNNQGFAYDTSLNVLYGASHGPFSDDEINIIERNRNYGHPLVEGFAADQNYNSISAGAAPNMSPPAPSSCPVITDEVANAAAIGPSYKDPLFSAYTQPTPVSPTNFTTMQQLWNATSGANNIWPSEGWSGLDLYTNTIIPGWKRSLVAAGLKWGRLIRLRLGPTGTTTLPSNLAYGNTGDTVTYFQSTNRYRDLAFAPNGKDIFVIMDNSSATSGPGIGNPMTPACPGCLLKYTFLGYSNVGGKSSIPNSIDVTDTSTYSFSYAPINTVDSATTVTIDNTNNNLWVPITGPDGNILAEIYPNGYNLGVIHSAFFKHKGPIRVKGNVRYLDRNITITPQVQPGDSVKIRLYITKSEFDSLNADPLSGIVGGITGLKILKNEDPCSSSILSNTITVNTTYEETHGNGYMLQGNIRDFSSFYFASVNITLPLNLLTFKGSLQSNNTTLLQWETTNETNTSYFIIERSTDGKNFQQIGTAAAKGNTTKNTYSFIDDNAIYQPSSILYYRLKMVDQDGGYTYSNIVAISLPALTNRVTVFPNPASKDVRISLNVATDGKVKWNLTDNAGRSILQSSTQLKKGNNSFSIHVDHLTAGIYYLSVTGAGIDQKVKIEKL